MKYDSDPRWAWFRRVLLGTVVEVFRETGVRIDVTHLHMAFTEESEFRLSFTSTMRFVGYVEGKLLVPLDPLHHDVLVDRLTHVWPQLVSVVRVPMLPAMKVTRNQVRLLVEGDQLRVDFDLLARS